MKYLFIILVVTLSGCASSPIKLYAPKNLEPSNIAKITTSCNKLCSSAIKKQLGFDSRYQRNDGLLLEIDGKEGERKVKNGNAFNSSMDGSLNVEVEAGNHELVVDHNSRLVRGKPERFTVDLLGGHEYVVARIRVEYIKGVMYRWFPLVFDTTSNKVVYANNRSFNESAQLTCAKHNKSDSFCKCLVNSLNQTLSYKDKEAMIMNRSKNENLLDLATEQIEQCRN